jgi:hypothetical protein
LILHDGPGFHQPRPAPGGGRHPGETTLLEKGEGGLFYYSRMAARLPFQARKHQPVNADGTNLRRDVLVFPSVTTYSEYQYHPTQSGQAIQLP